MIPESKKLKSYAFCILLLFSSVIGGCTKSNPNAKNSQSKSAMDSTTDEADNVPFDDDPKEFDTTVTMNNIAYSLHVNYRSLNDNQIKQRVWYSTQQGADTPGVFVTSNREIEIAIHKGGQLLVDTRIRKETLRLSDESLATEMLGAPSYLRTQDGLLVFGVPIGELDSEESSWVEFGIDTTGKVSVLSQISET